MKDFRTITATTAAVLCALFWAGSLRAYTIITRDGHRLEVKSRPEVREGQAYMRLVPHGQLAVMNQEKIDWARTEAVNPEARPVDAPPLAVPSDEKLVQSEPAPAPASPQPHQIKIVGTPQSKQEERENPAQVAKEDASPQKQINKQEALVKLQKEYADLAAERERTLDQKHVYETELAVLQEKQTSHAGGDNPDLQRIRELQDRINEAGAQLNRLEIRMNDIRSEAVQLGGSID